MGDASDRKGANRPALLARIAIVSIYGGFALPISARFPGDPALRATLAWTGIALGVVGVLVLIVHTHVVRRDWLLTSGAILLTVGCSLMVFVVPRLWRGELEQVLAAEAIAGVWMVTGLLIVVFRGTKWR